MSWSALRGEPHPDGRRLWFSPTLAGEGQAATLFRFVVAPLAGGMMINLVGRAAGGATVLAGILAFSMGALLTAGTLPAAVLLPVMNAVRITLGPLLGGALIAGAMALTGKPNLTVPELAACVLVTAGVAMVPLAVAAVLRRRMPRLRVALIGSERSAASLARELREGRSDRWRLVGRIGWDQEERELGEEVADLGDVRELGEILMREDVHLLVVGPEAPRLKVFDALAQPSLDLRTRVCDLVFFYEEVFGHIPVAAINTTWFNFIMHPRYRVALPVWKRLLDVVVAVSLGLLFLPLLLAAAILIRLDGRPVLFRQTRIGEGGRPFTLYKLRTMRSEDPQALQWAAKDDPRVTWVGRLLRRFHLDELPQLLNVLRGEMSMVGPRPEQPGFIARLETLLPHYQRRHLIKPGMTGWAQVRCGYAGSDVGSAWKLCHDLFYVKYRSILLDLMILAETARALWARPYDAIQSESVAFILAPEPLQATVNGDGHVLSEATREPR